MSHGGVPAAVASPPPLPPRPSALASDRRRLLQLLLETRGVRGLSDADLDRVDVPALALAWRTGTAFHVLPGREVPELRAVPDALAPPQLASRPAVAAAVLEPAPVFAKRPTAVSTAATNSARGGDELDSPASTSTSSTSDDDDDSPLAAAPAESPAQAPLVLTPALPGDMDDELSTAAFQLHAAACLPANGKADALSKFMRAQLGVAPELADHLWAVLPAWRGGADGGGASALSLRLPAALLGMTTDLVPKTARRWQRVQLSQLLCALPGAAGDALRAQLYSATGEVVPAVVAQLRATVDARGWAVPAEPLGAALYSALVRAQWDDLDDSSGTQVEEAPLLLQSLRRLWEPLGVGQVAHTAHCLFSAVQRWALGGSTDALKAARSFAAQLASGGGAGAAAPDAERAHVRLALAPVATRCSTLLNDYHAHFPNGADEGFLLLIDIMRDVRAALASPAVQVADMIRASLSAAYTRLRKRDAPESVNGRTLPVLARSTQELADVENELFTPLLEKCEPAAACIAAAHLQALFARDMHECLRTTANVEEALPGLKAAEALVSQLQSCAIGGAAGEPPPPVDVAALAEPLVSAWVSARLAQSRQWMERALKAERWQVSATAATGSAAASAVDVVRAANEAADAFFALQVLQVAPARALAQGISGVLAAYASLLLQQLGDPARHTPRAPPLTRFKQEAVEVLMQEHARAPIAGADERAAAAGGPSPEDLMAMFSSLAFMLRELPATEHSIQRQWVALSRAAGTLRRGVPDVASLTGLFSETSRALRDAQLQVLTHVGSIVVFRHLRRSFIDAAYVFGTKAPGGRLPVTLLEPLNPWMERVCGALGDDDRHDAAGAMLAAVVRGLRFVLLDGGPTRIFLQDDSDALEADLEAVRDFFVAGGEGLPAAEVHDALVPLSRLLDAMAQDTHHLIALHGREATMWDKDTLLRVLCHRGDRTSSKYLKATAHVGKAIGFIEEKRQILASMAHGRAR